MVYYLTVGHGAMETTAVNMVEPGEVALVLTNGIWGDRFAGMVTRYGLYYYIHNY